MNKYVGDTLSDCRINQIMNIIKETLSSKNECIYNKKTFDISKIKEESKFFPLCMNNLYMNLVQTNRLAHNDRLEFITIILKRYFFDILNHFSGLTSVCS